MTDLEKLKADYDAACDAYADAFAAAAATACDAFRDANKAYEAALAAQEKEKNND
jgi:hypothetical protein